MIVVADTTPINYLILIGQIEILARLYGRVILPVLVHDELLHPRSPAPVREWIAQPPNWLEISTPSIKPDASLARLGSGERDAILLAEERACDELIIDEALGRRAAEQRGLPIIGTIGVLREASEFGLLDLRDAFDRLRHTSFHISPEVLRSLLPE